MLVKKDLFIKEISIEKNEIDNYNIYPFDIDLVKNFEKLNLSSPVTFSYWRKWYREIHFYRSNSN